MKTANIYKTGLGLMVGAFALMIACSPKNSDKVLGPKPTASFTATPITGRTNAYLLTNTTPGAFFSRWDNGDGGGAREGKLIDTAYYPDKGTYTIKLLVLSEGGYDTAKQTVTVAADDPNGCSGNKALLTGCTQKTWILDQPGGGALFVGDPGGGQWWANGAGDVTARSCQFDDEWTFKKDGSMIFNNFDNMWIEDEGGAPWPVGIGLPVGCTPMSAVPAPYKPWGSGNFTFKIVGGNKITVTGKGAHLGIYKVGEAGTTATPDDFITYDILEMTATKMVVRKMYSWGQWKFTYKVK